MQLARLIEDRGIGADLEFLYDLVVAGAGAGNERAVVHDRRARRTELNVVDDSHNCSRTSAHHAAHHGTAGGYE